VAAPNDEHATSTFGPKLCHSLEGCQLDPGVSREGPALDPPVRPWPPSRRMIRAPAVSRPHKSLIGSEQNAIPETQIFSRTLKYKYPTAAGGTRSPERRPVNHQFANSAASHGWYHALLLFPPGSFSHTRHVSSRARPDSSIFACHRLLLHSLHVPILVVQIDPPSHFQCPHSIKRCYSPAHSIPLSAHPPAPSGQICAPGNHVKTSVMRRGLWLESVHTRSPCFQGDNNLVPMEVDGAAWLPDWL
jgi:hypothetical protein